ncbi:MAG: 2'-5' RNA ligase [Candidatus Aminicenantes bacterium RBG_19FT_COMBO_59_29]|nr:MAG: 2'-5' RNA ligase [Candidatus Aminicenantes bacterium RBG_19FT_COMBO_59_29]
MRTFIAIDLDESLKKALETFAGKLKPLARNVSWVGAAGMHLTLKFLGEISEADAARVSSALEETAARHRVFALVLEGTGTFPPGRRQPRVLWVGVSPGPPLLALQEDVEREMAKLGFEREKRPFHPHLTLGRVKSPAGLDPLVQEIRQQQDRRFGEMSVQKFSFFQSILKPSGAEYTVLKEFRLR